MCLIVIVPRRPRLGYLQKSSCNDLSGLTGVSVAQPHAAGASIAGPTPTRRQRPEVDTSRPKLVRSRASLGPPREPDRTVMAPESCSPRICSTEPSRSVASCCAPATSPIHLARGPAPQFGHRIRSEFGPTVDLAPDLVSTPQGPIVTATGPSGECEQLLTPALLGHAGSLLRPFVWGVFPLLGGARRPRHLGLR